jgi:flagellar protein FliO/FliZ
MTSALTSLLGFVAIVALIPLALWLLKRTPIGGGAAHGVMRTVAMLPISANQRLLTVEVGSGDDKKWLVLGVTAAGITTLHTMAPQAIEPAAGPLPPFAQLLAKHWPALQRKDHRSADAR